MESELEEKILKETFKEFMDLQYWLYKNHIEVLRDYEKSKGRKTQIMFIDKDKK